MSSKHGLILPFKGVMPKIHPTARVMPSAVVIGNVEIGPESCVWFGTVLRGDVGSIKIGARSNIQDNSVVHLTGGMSETIIGDDVTIGHKAMVHGCTVKDGCLVGMDSIILDNAVLETEVFLAAGSLVTTNTVLPEKTLCMGRPAKVARELAENKLLWMSYSAKHYVELMQEYGDIGLLPQN
jgi:carbonic anhydrase/acetyltransferase-like protein (isoleucine patch superfamily)